MTGLGRVAIIGLLAVVMTGACGSTPAAEPESPAAAFSVRWAKVMTGPTSEDEFDGVAAAPDGSVYVTGKFQGDARLGGRHLQSAGAADIPFAHFDAAGKGLWVKRFGGPGEDNFFDVDASADGAVATGWFSGQVRFGSVTLTSSGPSDCAVVALGPDGKTRWARRFGGPGRDGCNEVTVDGTGAVTTSIDTQGDWKPVGERRLPRVSVSETVLMRLAADGSPTWMRAVLGVGAQRGKSIAVAPDGSVSFGGDSIGAFTIGDRNVHPPAAGGRRDAFLSRWSPTGALEWVKSWGGPGDDYAKGVIDDGESVSYVGPFTGTIKVGGGTLDAGQAPAMLVAQRSVTGQVQWATSVRADGPLEGAEVAAAADGGMLFGGRRWPRLRFGSATGPPIRIDSDRVTAWLAHYRPDGTPAFVRTIAGTPNGGVGEIARAGSRIYVDIVLRGSGNKVNGKPIAVVGKDASVWALDLAG